MMTVLIDQDHVQDFLVELENSPMSIEVKDFELQRPTARVNKPEKGASEFGGYMGQMGGMMGGMGGMGGGMMGMMRMRGMSGYGGMMGGSQAQMAMGRMGMMGGMGAMAGMRGGAGPAAERKGKDVRKETGQKTQATGRRSQQVQGPVLFDPYFDIVEVTVYGQARFFIPPPPLDPRSDKPRGGSGCARGCRDCGGVPRRSGSRWAKPRQPRLFPDRAGCRGKDVGSSRWRRGSQVRGDAPMTLPKRRPRHSGNPRPKRTTIQPRPPSRRPRPPRPRTMPKGRVPKS